MDDRKTRALDPLTKHFFANINTKTKELCLELLRGPQVEDLLAKNPDFFLMMLTQLYRTLQQAKGTKFKILDELFMRAYKFIPQAETRPLFG